MKLEQVGALRVFTRLGLAFGKSPREPVPRCDFAVGEALRRELLEGRFGGAPAGQRAVPRRHP